jgi:hypothetical protein
MRLPLAVEVVSRDGTLGRDATLKNGLVEANGEDFILRKRPGMYDLGSVGAGASQVLAAWQDRLVGVAGDLITSSYITTGQPESGVLQNYAGKGVTFGVAANGAYAVAAFDHDLYRSTNDGESFASVLNVGGSFFGSIAYGNGVFVAVIPAATSNDIRYSTDNGATWNSATSGASVTKSLSFAGGYFFLTGANGKLYTSANGSSWTDRTISTTNDLSPVVVYGGGKWVIGTVQGVIYSATAISTWTANPVQPAAPVVYGNGVFVGHDGGDLYYSDDGINFTFAYETGDSILTPVAFFDGAFWSKAEYGDLLFYSTDGVTWYSQTVPDGGTSGVNTTVSAFYYGLFIGAVDQIFRYQIISSEKITVETSLSLSPTTADLDLWWNLSGAAASSQYLFLKNAEQGFLLDSTLTLSEITDGDYPASTVPGVVWLDGTFYVMDATARIYGSDLNNPAAWNALNFITGIKEPGAGKAIAKSQNYVIAFKEWSTEFFFDAGNATGSPLSPVDNGFTLIGCASGETVTEVDGTLFWVSQTKQNGRGVHMMIGLESKEITTPSVQRILNRDDLAQVSAYGLRIGGAVCYVLTLHTTDVTLVYNVQSGKWSEWSSLTAKTPQSCTITRDGQVAIVTCNNHGLADGDPALIAGANDIEYNGRHQIRLIDANTFSFYVENSPVTPATGTITATGYTDSRFKLTKHVKALGRDLLLHETNGHIYTPKDSAYSDDAPIDFIVKTGKFDGGRESVKTCASVSLIGNKSDAEAMMRWSDDDRQSNSKFRRVDLSTERAKLARCGSFRRRSFDIRHVADEQIQISALEIETGA